jgi:hypothetical protein
VSQQSKAVSRAIDRYGDELIEIKDGLESTPLKSWEVTARYKGKL